MKRQSKKNKIRETVESWIENEVRFCLTDCCDSMRQAERDEERFGGLVADSISIKDYIRANCLKKYKEIELEQAEESGTAEEELDKQTACALPIPYKEIKEL